MVFQCRDEGPIRAIVKWVREGGRPLPVGSTTHNGRLEMPNIQVLNNGSVDIQTVTLKKNFQERMYNIVEYFQVSDSGTYICQAVGYPKYTPGSELSVRLTVEACKNYIIIIILKNVLCIYHKNSI